MKKLLTVLCAVLLSVAPAMADQVGILDNLTVLENYPKAIEAHNKIMGIRNEFKNKVEKIQADLETSIKAAKDDKAKAKLEQDATTKFQAEKVRFESLVQSISKEIDDNVQAAIEKVAKGNGLNVIVSKNQVYYGGKDITQLVIDELKVSSPAPAKPVKK